jgi:hypothetical protein
MIRYIFIVFLLFIVSCKSELKQDKDYYPSGNIKKERFYDTNLELDSLKFYYDSIKKITFSKSIRKNEYDSIVFYYKNGNVFKTGKQTYNALKFGNWIRYTKEGYTSDIREYFIINDNSILNRNFYLDNKGDTTWYGRKFNTYDQVEFRKDTFDYRNSIMVLFDFYNRDTISLKEPFAASVRCGTPLMRDKNSEIMMLLAKEKYNFNKYFSNEIEVKLDTFKNLKYDKDNVSNFQGVDKEYVAVFGRWFKKPGKKTLRGYMLEYASFLGDKGDTLKGERRVYFEKTIYVKDTLK